MKSSRIIISALFLAMAIPAWGQVAAPTAPMPEKYVVFVNVGEVVSNAVFQKAAQEACQQSNVRFKTRAVARLKAKELSGAREKMAEYLDKDAVLTVFLINDEQTYDFLSAPGSWAMINAHILKQDKPTDEVYAKRMTKLLMKGLAHAAGVGDSMDARCVMYFGGFSPAGMDATSASFGPYAFFPLMETLRRLGGESLVAPEP